MARNRKRAKDARRTQPVAARRGDARAPRPDSAPRPDGGDGLAARPDGGDARAPERNGAPDPLSHATPDTELVEAQLAAGRGEPGGAEPFDEIDTPEEERELEDLATAGGDRGGADSGPRTPGAGGRGELAAPAPSTPARKPSAGSRLTTFLRGSWAELQRVQWPDRRQVMQATGVVIGFVIVAGVFLGVADWAAGKLMDLILK